MVNFSNANNPTEGGEQKNKKGELGMQGNRVNGDVKGLNFSGRVSMGECYTAFAIGSFILLPDHHFLCPIQKEERGCKVNTRFFAVFSA